MEGVMGSVLPKKRCEWTIRYPVFLTLLVIFWKFSIISYILDDLRMIIYCYDLFLNHIIFNFYKLWRKI